MIGTIVDVEIRETRSRGDSYLAVQFVDDYETKQWLFISPIAIESFKRFCEMTNFNWPIDRLMEFNNKVISVYPTYEFFQNRYITVWRLNKVN